MKLQILSDNHTFDYDIHPDADIVAHAGDFSNNLRGCLDFVEVCEDAGKEHIFVLGNHDYYGSAIDSVKSFFKDHPEYNCLMPEVPITIGDYTFVGGTLFTNFRANKILHTDPQQFDFNKIKALEHVRDFEQIIRKNGDTIEPEDLVTEFNKTYNFINTYRNKNKTVVITHFPPNLACLDPYWSVHPVASCLNPYFINDLDVSGFKLWLSGHTHTAVDTEVDGCRLVINPIGYPNEHYKNGYRDQLLINLDEIYE